jgi:hypothetical protein
MKPANRWLVAVLSTVAAFVAGTWICGAVVLSGVMKDSATRWGIAGAFGVAVAALAALWGHSFATSEQVTSGTPEDNREASAKDALTGSEGTHNEISGGNFHGMVIQGRDISPSISSSNLPQTGSQNEPKG